jgi:hypothetical protein
MMTTNPADLRQAAIRAAARPFYLASQVWPIAREMPDPWAWIAGRAGVALEDAPKLLLCANPESELQVELIAARFGAVGLAELLELCR